MKRDFRKGQSILEYTLVLAAVIGVVVAVLFANGGMKSKIEGAYNKAGDALSNTANSLSAGVFQ